MRLPHAMRGIRMINTKKARLQQFEFLKAWGCNLAQGYCIDPLLSAANAATVIGHA